jgi:hypothetical protein
MARGRRESGGGGQLHARAQGHAHTQPRAKTLSGFRCWLEGIHESTDTRRHTSAGSSAAGGGGCGKPGSPGGDPGGDPGPMTSLPVDYSAWSRAD